MADLRHVAALRWLRRGLDRARHLSRKLWVRISGIAALALVAAGLAGLVGPLLPAALQGIVPPEAVEDLLDVIASSMLAVTIFSLSVMVTVHRAVEGNWTPRAHRLLAQDHVTLTAVSVFLGGWLYALTAKILLGAAVVGGTEHVFLFFMTVVVVAMIVIVVMRWVAHLGSLGSLEQTGRRLEDETRAAFEGRAGSPFLGGHRLTPETFVAPGARAVAAPRTGWIVDIDADACEAAATSGDGPGVPIYLTAPIGGFVSTGETVARVAGSACAETVRKAIHIADLRDFAEDPGFGLMALSEVAQRALSPGVNDPGTAIEIMGRMLRALEAWVPETEPDAPERPHLWVPPLESGALVEAAFRPLARDGAASIEVVLAALSVLERLGRHPDRAVAEAAAAVARAVRRRAEAALEDPDDLARLEGGPQVGPTAETAPGPSRPIAGRSA